METLETIKTSLQQGEWVTFIVFKDAYFHIPIQEQSRKQGTWADIPVQGTAIWFVHRTHGVHCSSKGGETDGHTQGYKDPPIPIPRRLVVEGPNPTRFVSSKMCQQLGWLVKQVFNFVRYQFDLKSGRVDLHRTGGKTFKRNTETAIPTSLSGPGIHILVKFINSHRKASSPRSNAHETHTVASQKQLEGTRITRNSYPNSQVPAPPFTMVAKGRQYSRRSTITPNKTCSADLYRLIKRRVGHSLKRAHCTGNLVPSRKQAAYNINYVELKGVFSSLKRITGPLC